MFCMLIDDCYSLLYIILLTMVHASCSTSKERVFAKLCSPAILLVINIVKRAGRLAFIILNRPTKLHLVKFLKIY